MIKKLYAFVICFLLSSAVLQAQEKKDAVFVLSGKVIDKDTKKGIAFAHIKIDQTFFGTICDSLGFFRVRLTSNQKIKISALGYKTEELSVQSGEEGDIFKEIKMQRNSYMLSEVKVYALGSWNDFKYKFITKKLPPEKKIAMNANVMAIAKSSYQGGKSMRRGGLGVSINMKLGSGKAKKLNRLKAFMGSERKLQTIYNKDMVAQITREKGKRLELLMTYINCKAKFTAQSDEIYIIKEVQRLYKEFLKEKIDTSKYYSFFDTLPKNNHLRLKD